jgi:UDP-hydrolysing UDP-N-acetyl-D-glucosamine 2-epimerase
MLVTGTRAEWGLLRPVAAAIAARPELDLRVVVTGTHLVTGTWRDVAADGFAIAAKVAMQTKAGVGRAADVQALGRGVLGLGKALGQLQPEVVLVLGDRIEALAGALAGAVGGVRVAHIHGGDRAEGVADEALRHAISKLAHWHFAATAQSRKRLLRLGERSDAVWNVGSPAMDDLRDVPPHCDADGPYLILMQHPIGATDAQEERWMRATLRGSLQPGLGAYLFAPNHDPGRAGVMRALCGLRPAPPRGGIIEHLPRVQFLSLLAGAAAIVGNSSAGLIEAAALKVPCVNIGPRQAGREKPGNVVDCEYDEAAVRAALQRALGIKRGQLRHPYGNGDSGRRIAAVLATVAVDAVPLRKRNTY